VTLLGLFSVLNLFCYLRIFHILPSNVIVMYFVMVARPAVAFRAPEGG
jgi:hypothetical protein